MFLIIKIKWNPRMSVMMRTNLSLVRKAVSMKAGMEGRHPVTSTD